MHLSTHNCSKTTIAVFSVTTLCISIDFKSVVIEVIIEIWLSYKKTGPFPMDYV